MYTPFWNYYQIYPFLEGNHQIYPNIQNKVYIGGKKN